jgi:hypothetical protein
LSTPRAGTFARAGRISLDGSAPRRPGDWRPWEDGAPAAAAQYGKVRLKKTRDRFPGAGFCNSCDDDDMPVICPTCQIFWRALIPDRVMRRRSWARRTASATRRSGRKAGGGPMLQDIEEISRELAVNIGV